MKKSILSLLVMSGLLPHTPIFAATMQQIIQQQAKQELKRLNKLDADGYQSKLLMQQTVQIDFNGDKFLDSAALLTFCERENCHPTTVSYLLIAALGKGNNDFVFKDKTLPKHQTDSSTLTNSQK